MEHLGCSHTFTPSHSDEECRELSRYLSSDGGRRDEEDKVGYRILEAKGGEELAICYDEMPGRYGWWVVRQDKNYGVMS